MDNNEIKKANRKALPKFMLIMVISLLVGGSAGFCSAKYGLNSLSDGMKSTGAFFGMELQVIDGHRFFRIRFLG